MMTACNTQECAATVILSASEESLTCGRVRSMRFFADAQNDASMEVLREKLRESS